MSLLSTRTAPVRLRVRPDSDGSTPPRESQRLASIDALRGAAALSVVICHAAGFLPSAGAWIGGLRGLLMEGHHGVPLFFVISGFCIHMQRARHFAGRAPAPPQFGAFWRRRFFRLYPPYLAALAISLAFWVVAYLQGHANIYPDRRPAWLAADALAHVFMLHGLHPVFDLGAGNPAFWTLAREEYFYLMYFALIPARSRFGLVRTVVGVAALGILTWGAGFVLLGSVSPWFYVVRTSAVVLWIQWCLGMVSAEAYAGAVLLPRWTRSLLAALVFAVGAKLAERHAPGAAPLAFGLVFFSVVNVCVHLESRGAWPTSLVVTWLGRVGMFSYSLYLCHPVVQNVLAYAFRRIGTDRATPVAWRPGVAIAEFATLVLASYLAGRCFFRTVESRFLGTVRTEAAP